MYIHVHVHAHVMITCVLHVPYMCTVILSGGFFRYVVCSVFITVFVVAKTMDDLSLGDHRLLFQCDLYIVPVS